MSAQFEAVRTMLLFLGALVLLSIGMGWYIAQTVEPIDGRLDSIERCLAHIDSHYQAPSGTPEVPCQ